MKTHNKTQTHSFLCHLLCEHAVMWQVAGAEFKPLIPRIVEFSAVYCGLVRWSSFVSWQDYAQVAPS